MAEKYEVVKTLIRGKQSERKIETQQGVKITAHKKPVGYALKDVNTGKICEKGLGKNNRKVSRERR